MIFYVKCICIFFIELNVNRLFSTRRFQLKSYVLFLAKVKTHNLKRELRFYIHILKFILLSNFFRFDLFDLFIFFFEIRIRCRYFEMLHNNEFLEFALLMKMRFAKSVLILGQHVCTR